MTLTKVLMEFDMVTQYIRMYKCTRINWDCGLYVHTVNNKTYAEENVCSFRGFSTNHESFPTNL